MNKLHHRHRKTDSLLHRKDEPSLAWLCCEQVQPRLCTPNVDAPCDAALLRHRPWLHHETQLQATLKKMRRRGRQ